MAAKSNKSDMKTNLPRHGYSVKARIVASGVKLCEVAARAGYTRSSMSDFLSGKNRSLSGQIRIHASWCSLTGKRCLLQTFWGELLSPDHMERIPA